MSDNFDKRIKEATAARDAALEELTKLETTLQEQREKLSANRSTIAKGLSGLAIDKLLEHGQKISMSQQEIDNLELIISELERRLVQAKENVTTANRRINRIRAEAVDAEARVLEDKVAQLVRELVGYGEQIMDLNDQFNALAGLTRQQAFSQALLVERPQLALDEYEKDRNNRRPFAEWSTKVDYGVDHTR